MSWFSVDVNGNCLVLPGNQGVEKSKLIVVFVFKGKSDKRINGVERLVKFLDFTSFYN